jgi:hypothetical protein
MSSWSYDASQQKNGTEWQWTTGLYVLVAILLITVYFVANGTRTSTRSPTARNLSDKEPLYVVEAHAIPDENPTIIQEDPIVKPKTKTDSKFFQLDSEEYSKDYLNALQIEREKMLYDFNETKRWETYEDEHIPTAPLTKGPTYVEHFDQESRILAAEVHQEIPLGNSEPVLRDILAAKKEALAKGITLHVTEEQNKILVKLSREKGTVGHLASSILH